MIINIKYIKNKKIKYLLFYIRLDNMYFKIVILKKGPTAISLNEKYFYSDRLFGKKINNSKRATSLLKSLGVSRKY